MSRTATSSRTTKSDRQEQGARHRIAGSCPSPRVVQEPRRRHRPRLHQERPSAALSDHDRGPESLRGANLERSSRPARVVVSVARSASSPASPTSALSSPRAVGSTDKRTPTLTACVSHRHPGDSDQLVPGRQRQCARPPRGARRLTITVEQSTMDAFNRRSSHPRWPTADRNGREVARPVRQVADIMNISFIADCSLEAPRSGSVIPPRAAT
jgi:hypothetical protein